MEKVKVCDTRRFGAAKLQEPDFNPAGKGISQQEKVSVAVSQTAPTDELRLLPTSAELLKQRQRASDPSEIHDCQCKLGDSRWLATVSQPDICARLAIYG